MSYRTQPVEKLRRSNRGAALAVPFLLGAMLGACGSEVPMDPLDGGAVDGGTRDGSTPDAGTSDAGAESCGDGVLEPPETCDTGIAEPAAGSCPSSCDDGIACTRDDRVGSGCATTCEHTPIDACADGDGCCPSGCDATTDADCSPTCGNGTVEPPEICDTAIPEGSDDACPSECDDAVACTEDTRVGSGCSAECSFTAIDACADGDGCCPSGCDATTDADCSPTCGNGTVEPPETCDTAIASGDAGACPTACDDGMACTQDTLVGSGCSAACSFSPISACRDGDGCCPSGCTSLFDDDCACVPDTCAADQLCGTMPDGCGATITCGPTCGEWDPVADLPGVVSFAAAYAGPGRAALFGEDSATNVAETWEYDAGTDTWTQHALAHHPDPAGTPSRMAYAGGGIVVLHDYHAGTWEYDTATHAWTEYASAGGPSRSYHDLAYAGPGRVLLFGGLLASSGGGVADGTYLYSTTTHTWTLLSTPGLHPSARARHQMSWLGGGRVILAGGDVDDAWIFDTATASWSAIATPPTTFQDSMMAHLTMGRVLLYGGHNGMTPGRQRRFYQYDAATDTWTDRTGTPTDPGDLSAAAMAHLGPGRVLMQGGIYWTGATFRQRERAFVYYDGAGTGTSTDFGP